MSNFIVHKGSLEQLMKYMFLKVRFFCVLSIIKVCIKTFVYGISNSLDIDYFF